jgi:hypothetical protein
MLNPRPFNESFFFLSGQFLEPRADVPADVAAELSTARPLMPKLRMPAALTLCLIRHGRQDQFCRTFLPCYHDM